MKIGEVEIGEDSFGGKQSCKRIRERGLVARAGIKEAMCSKDTVREKDGKKEDEEGTESDTEIVTEL